MRTVAAVLALGLTFSTVAVGKTGSADAADLSTLTSDDRRNIETACILTRANRPVAYNNCVGQQLANLGSQRAADLSTLTFDDRRNIETACILTRANGPVAYNNCVGQQLANLGSQRAAVPLKLNATNRYLCTHAHHPKYIYKCFVSLTTYGRDGATGPLFRGRDCSSCQSGLRGWSVLIVHVPPSLATMSSPKNSF